MLSYIFNVLWIALNSLLQGEGYLFAIDGENNYAFFEESFIKLLSFVHLKLNQALNILLADFSMKNVIIIHFILEFRVAHYLQI